MKKNFKKILSLLLVAIMILSCTPATVFAINGTSVDFENGNVELDSNSTFGSMLSNAIEEETDITSNYSVSSIEFNYNIATISYKAEKDCTLLVGIYDEETDEMFDYISKNVYDFETETTVSFNEIEIPKYFVAKAYLVDDNGAALCKNYVSYIYTKAFEDSFTNVTVNDFEEEKVINLDESEITNFAVISDTTKKIEKSGTTNLLESVDENGDVYIFSNIDNEIKVLKPGDIFWYYTGIESEIYIIKVKDIDVDDTTAIITSDQTSIDEVFDYVKIDESDDKYEMQFTPLYDESDENDVAETYNTRRLANPKINVGDTFSKSVSYQFGKDGKGWNVSKNVKVTGSVTLEVGGEIKVYYKSHMIRDNYLQVEASISPKFAISASISAEMKDKAVKSFAEISISPCPGLYIKFTPSIVIKASTKITISGTLTAKLGFEYNNIEGFVDKCEKPNFKPEVKVEGEFFIGIDMRPHISIIHEKVADAGITAETGFTIKAETDKKSDTHTCYVCLDGDINFGLKVSAYVTFINKYKVEGKIFDLTTKLVDFYYSADHFEFDWGECPYKKTDVAVEYNGHYYYVFDISKNWTEAKDYCESIGGHLVTITTSEEQKFLTNKMLKVGFKNCYWLGGYKENYDFKWITGEDFTYSNWKSGEPNNQLNREDYLEIFRGTYNDISVGQWNDIMHDGRNGELDKPFYSPENMGFICEWENYENYRDHASELRKAKTMYKSVSMYNTELINQNDLLDNVISATFFENKIDFIAKPENIYMIYSLDQNKDIKYILQVIANENGNVKSTFFKTPDTETYIVGDFGDGIKSLSMNLLEHNHYYIKEVINPSCTVDGMVISTCSCGLTYTEVIASMGHSFTEGNSKCSNCDFDKADNCGCKCHKTGFISKIIWFITNFFNKLFKKNQVCNCGKVHF